MLSAVSTDSATKKVAATGTAASIIDGSTMHNRTSVSSVSLMDPSSVAIVDSNLASFKDDFDDANSHWFLSSEVSYLLLVVELIILFVDEIDATSQSY